MTSTLIKKGETCKQIPFCNGPWLSGVVLLSYLNKVALRFYVIIGRTVAILLTKVVLKIHIASGFRFRFKFESICCLFLISDNPSYINRPSSKKRKCDNGNVISNFSKCIRKLLDKDASELEELKTLNDIHCKQYEKVLAMLTDDNLPRRAIKEYASQTLQHSIQQKRKFEEITSEDYLSEDQYSEVENAHHKYMDFVEIFRKERAEKGIRMDWKLCLEEGKKKSG
ncbi:hypothetical protein K501DRAFT_273306 [Backusella circina FSU 941]|nr:hypothetical protein K501DRAFT_273306 [Backusella circina FSU 941]